MHRRNQRGQAIVEAALFLPLLFLILFGTFDLSTLASDKVQSYSAVRHGVRIASELGGVPNNPGCNGTLPATTTVASIDKQIVEVVLAAAKNMSYVVVNEVDIYQPSDTKGDWTVGVDPVNQYNGTTGAAIGTGNNFALTQRCQGPLGSNPKDTSIGVKIKWTYTAQNGLGFGKGPLTFNLSEYAVQKMQQCVDNCL
jgi:Flp pilus assembly protein TadG